jgi:endoglucanase
MGVDAPGGYISHPLLKDTIIAVVDAAIEQGIYVIIDFHTSNANSYVNEAKTFFNEMSAKYKDSPNVLYEVWNEPGPNVSWSDTIKPYCETIINVIRQNDPDNIIICGTPTYSQDVDIAALNPITIDPNIAYTLHFYAATHKDWLRGKALRALNLNIPLFVTEYGTCEASGSGTMDTTETQLWWDFLEENLISYCNWSVANKAETSAILTNGNTKIENWQTSDLTPSGQFVRDHLLLMCDGTNVTGLFSPLAPATDIRFYPNPFTETVFIELKEESDYTVIDMLGNIVESGSGSGKTELGRKLAKGLYIVKIKDLKGERVIKIHKR